MSKRIGFIGLGDMGGPMAANIAASGVPVIAFDKAGTSERGPDGATIAQSAGEVARAAGSIFLSLPDAEASLAVAGEIAATQNVKARTVIDLSTIGIEAARRAAAILDPADIAYVDAPVSGGRAGAVKGTITVMWSGSQGELERHRPVLASFAGSVFFIGPTPGQGQAMKLLNNFLSATAMAATSEAVQLGLHHGLDMKSMLDVLNVSTGRNTATSDKFPNRILTGTFDAGFRMALMHKDAALYLHEAETAGTAGEVARVVAGIWRQGAEARPEGDFTEIFAVLAKAG